eukprot:TRINITY_DN2868_c0_g1_i1.p1 TRINITY_DN2868_c0_g1~~TRINITY_DN2868_c0_g1_i1.p1  ORF type:complete len:358 (+),score=63.79 TRINITY_DN2868_c0_g1_i1:691-1764(+)
MAEGAFAFEDPLEALFLSDDPTDLKERLYTLRMKYNSMSTQFKLVEDDLEKAKCEATELRVELNAKQEQLEAALAESHEARAREKELGSIVQSLKDANTQVSSFASKKAGSASVGPSSSSNSTATATNPQLLCYRSQSIKASLDGRRLLLEQRKMDLEAKLAQCATGPLNFECSMQNLHMLTTAYKLTLELKYALHFLLWLVSHGVAGGNIHQLKAYLIQVAPPNAKDKLQSINCDSLDIPQMRIMCAEIISAAHKYDHMLGARTEASAKLAQFQGSEVNDPVWSRNAIEHRGDSITVEWLAEYFDVVSHLCLRIADLALSEGSGASRELVCEIHRQIARLLKWRGEVAASLKAVPI